jgi:hypothetical protein
LVYNNAGTPYDISDDVLISATPHEGSTYARLIDFPLNRTFDVSKLTEVVMEVVCFQPTTYGLFGFQYFKLQDVTAHQQWFKGNGGTNVNADTNIVQYKIETYHNGVLENTFVSNDGLPLSVLYSDYKYKTDSYTFKLYILQDAYNYYRSFTFNDISNIPSNFTVLKFVESNVTMKVGDSHNFILDLNEDWLVYVVWYMSDQEHAQFTYLNMSNGFVTLKALQPGDFTLNAKINSVKTNVHVHVIE